VIDCLLGFGRQADKHGIRQLDATLRRAAL